MLQQCLSLMDEVKTIYSSHSFQKFYNARLLIYGNTTSLASLYSCIFTLSSFPQMLYFKIIINVYISFFACTMHTCMWILTQARRWCQISWSRLGIVGGYGLHSENAGDYVCIHTYGYISIHIHTYARATYVLYNSTISSTP